MPPALSFYNHAGHTSAFYEAALPHTHARRGSDPDPVVDQLMAWADLATAGVLRQPLQLQMKVAAATDLMEQAGQLLEEKQVHPAAPVMLAGAALESFLRGLCDLQGVTPAQRGISGLGNALRAADAIDGQEIKDITAWAGLRNHAAHGEFDAIAIERAQIMVDGVNLFMRQRAQ